MQLGASSSRGKPRKTHREATEQQRWLRPCGAMRPVSGAPAASAGRLPATLATAALHCSTTLRQGSAVAHAPAR